MARAWIEDGWKGADGTPTAEHGHGSRWRVYWWADVVADPAGRARRRRSKKFRRKPDAEAWAARIENDLRAGTYRPPEHAETLFAVVADEWLTSRLDVKPTTWRRYERELRMYVLPTWGARRIGTITKAEVAAWVADLANGRAPARYAIRGTRPVEYEPVATMRRPLGASSIEHLHTVLSAVLGWAVETDRIGRNPATRVRLPRAADVEQVYLSHAEVEALATAAHGITDRATDRVLVLLLAYTGLRINEALALRGASLNLAARRARVTETWTEDRDGNRVLGPPKTHERRAVPLPRFLVDELVTLVDGRDRDEFVFQAARGGPLFDHNWRARVWPYAVHDADLDGHGLTPHKLRHTAASAAIAAGADVKVVQQMLGHKDATETLNTYGHLWPERLDEVSTALEAARADALATSGVVVHVPGMSPTGT